MTDTKKTKKVHGDVSPELGRRIKAIAALRDESIPEAVSRMLEMAIAQAEAETRKEND